MCFILIGGKNSKEKYIVVEGLNKNK